MAKWERVVRAALKKSKQSLPRAAKVLFDQAPAAMKADLLLIGATMTVRSFLAKQRGVKFVLPAGPGRSQAIVDKEVRAMFRPKSPAGQFKRKA